MWLTEHGGRMLGREREAHERRLAGIAKLESRLTFRLAILQRLLDRQIGRILARHGLPLAGYRVLVTIEACEELTAAELVRMIAVDKALVSRACADLIAAGALEARPDPASARRRLLRLTGRGRALLERVEPEVAARNARLDALFSSEERGVLDRALERLTRHTADRLDDAPDLQQPAA